VFVKPAHGSSASGVLALQVGRGRVMATTSVQLSDDGTLYNSLRVRRYDDERSVAAIVDRLAPDGLHVEQWFPKAAVDGRTHAGLQVLQNTLADTIPSRFLRNGRQVIVTASDGEVIATAPYEPAYHGRRIENLLGDVLLLTTFGSRADTREITLPDGSKALAVHRFAEPPKRPPHSRAAQSRPS